MVNAAVQFHFTPRSNTPRQHETTKQVEVKTRQLDLETYQLEVKFEVLLRWKAVR